MERISIFNYEAFYLDYLEGTLSEEDTKMLLQFLEEHPECRMEEEDLVTLDDVVPMTFSGKQNLKQVDEEGPIVADNVEHFMIADAEGILSEEKTAELDAVVANNEDLEATRRRYNAVYYTPEESVVYGAKGDLKQRRTIALWPYMTGAVAAAAVVAIMMIPSTFEGTIGDVNSASVIPTGEVNNDPDPEVVDPKKDDIKPISADIKKNNPIVFTASTNTNATGDKPVTRLTRMDRRANMQISPANVAGDVATRPVNMSDAPPIYTGDPNSKPSFGPKMENPIEPITAFISYKSKKDVEFKRRKASEDKKGGFLLKIGKFEFSKNKH